MTNAELTLLAVLLDRSGSMQSIKSDTDGGFDAYIEEQRALPGSTRVTLAQFDTEYECLYADLPIERVPALDLRPRGGTALYDAVGKLVTEVGESLADRPENERPGTVIVVVLTDGHENSSREWTHEAVRALITQQQEVYSWDFLFLGANMDAVRIGSQMGFDPRRSITYTAAPAGVAGAFRAGAAYSARRRTAPAAAWDGGFSDEERAAAQPGQEQV